MGSLSSTLAATLGGDDEQIEATFRALRILLPDARAWRLAKNSAIRRLMRGLAETPTHARGFVDGIFGDLFPVSTRVPELWEAQFGLVAGTDDATRRKQIDAAWKATGGQSPRYIQDVIQAAGFDVYVHEWWVPGSTPRVARDPRSYTHVPLIGTVQCGEPTARCGESSARCNRFLANETDYIVNKNLTNVAPPPVPSDPTRWPFFVYFGAETFPSRASVPAARRDEFERLLLKLRPQQQWLVTLIDYV